MDGTSAEVERVYGDFLGVVVPEGTHEVTLAFRPVHARLGMLISVASVLAALILAVR